APFVAATPPRLFDLSDPLAPVEITYATYDPVAGGHQLAFASIDTPDRRYMALPDSSFETVSPTDLAAVFPSNNLRSRVTQQADYVVIYYDEFKTAAEDLAQWRREHDGFKTSTIAVSAIYDQFSGGRVDPTAIRNFLRAAFWNWS